MKSESELPAMQWTKEAEAEIMQWEQEAKVDASTRAAHVSDLRLLIFTVAFLDEVVKRGYLREFGELLGKKGEQRLSSLKERPKKVRRKTQRSQPS